MSAQKVAVLAPGSTIARAVAERLFNDGSQLALVGRELSGLSLNSADYSETCSLTDFEAVEAALGVARESMGGLTGVANCAGSMLLKPAHLTTREEFDATVQCNLTTAFSAVRAAAKYLDKEGGSVVLISSAAARLGMPNHEIIATVKAGIEGLVRSAAATYASRKLRFNAVAPGLVATALSENLLSNPTSRKVSEALHPLGRIGSPEEVASAICWLLHPEQSWVTGQVIGVDGGLGRVQPRPKIGPAKS